MPIFLIAIGLTWYHSFRNSGSSLLRELYSRKYLKRRLSRILVPFIMIVAIDLAITIATNRLSQSVAFTIVKAMIGSLHPELPGLWFIPLLLELIFIAPLLYYLFRRSPVIALVVTFVIDLGFELCGTYLPLNVYNSSILRYIAALGIGFYIAPELLTKGKLNLMDRRFLFIVPLAALSAVLLVIYNGASFSFFQPEWRTQNLFTFFYPALLVILIFNLYSPVSKTIFHTILELTGRASYHIFLIQMLYFGYLYSGFDIHTNGIMSPYVYWPILIISTLVVNIMLGIVLYKIEGVLREKLNRMRLGNGTRTPV